MTRVAVESTGEPEDASARSMDSMRSIPGWLAPVAWLVVIGFEIAALAVWRAGHFGPTGFVFMSGPLVLPAFFVGITAQATSGLILLTKRPGNTVGWIIMAFALVTGASAPLMAATTIDSSSAGSWHAWVNWAGGALLFPAASFQAFLLAFIFPNGRLLSPAWRNALSVVLLASVIAAIALATRPGPLVFFPTTLNPAFEGGANPVPTAIALILMASSSGLAGAALIARYRVSDPITQVQIRWYISAGVVLATAYIAYVIAVLTLPPFDSIGQAIATIEYLALALPPIAITIAILRYRLYDIDAIISRAFVYGALTALLAGIYTASIRLFNAVFVATTGESSDIALVITTLLLATTFTPIKSRLERVVSRRVGSLAPAPSAAAALLADPAFNAELDTRIRQAVADARAARSGRPRADRSS
jgi:hypothetical protein